MGGAVTDTPSSRPARPLDSGKRHAGHQPPKLVGAHLALADGHQVSGHSHFHLVNKVACFVCSFFADTVCLFAVRIGRLAGQTGKIVK